MNRPTLAVRTIFALGLLHSTAHADPATFDEDARLIYRVVACGDDSPIPANLDAEVVERHCTKMRSSIERYRKGYDRAKDYIAAELPPAAPTTVVYPFGGGDLISALTTFPLATDVTTLSLEQAGDPRRLRVGVPKKSLETSLALVRSMSAGLLHYNDSKTENLQKLQRGEVPGQIALFMIALAVHGYEPIGLRYVRPEPDGTLHALSTDEIQALDVQPGKKVRSAWVSPDFSPAFADSEITFRKKGDPSAPVRTHHHFGADLSNTGFSKDSPIGRFLGAKGKVSAMTKAASYLLWRDHFSNIRNYLIDNLVVMVSDSTGIPPAFAQSAGLKMKAYGAFEQPFLNSSQRHAEGFRRLFRDNTIKPLPFRYGYIDGSPGKHYHLVVTERESAEDIEPAKPEPPMAPKLEPTPQKMTRLEEAPTDKAPRPVKQPAVKQPAPNPAPPKDHRTLPVARPTLVAAESESESELEPAATSTSVARDDAGPPRLTLSDEVLGGKHLRLITSRGAAHVWLPRLYSQKAAGTVVYVHGYHVAADQAWEQHGLAKQFETSKRNAVFIVPDAPASDEEDVFHADLGALLGEIERLGTFKLPRGPVVALGHSGGFRTIADWLEFDRLDQIVLLDGLYNQGEAFQAWLFARPKRHLVLVSVDTTDRAKEFQRNVQKQAQAQHVRGNVDVIQPPYDHLALVEAGRTIPVVLSLTSLRMVTGAGAPKLDAAASAAP
ncbi:MAG: hypothetical protein HY791_15680 [Deltaproteobacteria bacterium]|nr:hypothetical protein [Deltaproteobacteria bacterium]